MNAGKYLLHYFIEPICGPTLAEVFGRKSIDGVRHLYSGADCHQVVII